MSLISVIIPTYNRADLLPKTLDSVKNQTFKDYEILVIDDGSEDKTENVITKNYPSVHYEKITHSGLPAAKNQGIKLAKGEFITFIDSDDLWEPNFLKELYLPLSSVTNYSFSYCNSCLFNENGIFRDFNLMEVHKKSGNIFPQILQGFSLSTGSFLIKKECFDAAGWHDENLKYCNDWDIWLRLSKIFEGIYVDKVLLKIRKHENNMSKDRLKTALYNIRIIKKFQKEFNSTELHNRRKIKQVLYDNYRRAAHWYNKKGRMILAFKYYFLAATKIRYAKALTKFF